MPLRMIATIVTAAWLLLYGQATNAQQVEPIESSGSTVGVWTAFARNEPLKTRAGRTHDRDLYLVGLRARWSLARRPNVEFAYTVDLLPAVISTGMPAPAEPAEPYRCPPGEFCWVTPPVVPVSTQSQTVYGAGVAPLGLELRVRGTQRVALLLRGSAGLVRFSEPIPDPGERKGNFIFDIGALIEARVSRRLGFIAGYRLNHISNAGTGPVNPGMNSRMLEIGLMAAR